MDDADVERIREQIEDLIATGEQSATAEFELETADGGSKIVENRLALIGDDEFRGSAGVLRDITAREEQRQQLESFQRAVEEAADGIAILDGDEYIYIDQSHVDMYGLESKDQLLGKTWRELYDETEAKRLEQEVFPALEAEGHWRGMVTGRRADGSTFPAELSLTIVEDGRLVCTVRDETERRARERELELKEQAMDETEAGIQITGPAEEGTPLVYVNDGFERLTGYTREESLGRNPRFLQGTDTDPGKRQRLREAINSEEPVSLELQNTRKDGTLYWSRLSITPVTNDRGTVQNYIGIQQDVTERKAREAALTDSQERYETLLEAAPDPVFVADAETGEIVETNAAAEELVGRPREELVGLNQIELHPQDDTDLYRAAFEDATASPGVLSELPNGDQPKLCCAGGETIPVEINTDTVQLPDGPVIYGVFRDVSKRREHEQELELKERAMDEASVGITISDPDREDNPLVYVNDGFVEQTGYNRSDAVGRNCRFLQADDRDQQALDDLRNAIAADKAITVDLRNYRQNGEQFWNRLSVTPVYDDDGTLTNHIGIQQDVTEEKTREQRLRALLETTQNLLQTDTLEEATSGAVESLATEFELQQVAFYRRDGDTLVSTALTGTSTAKPPERIERGQTPAWEAVETGEPIQYDDCGAIGDGVDRGDVNASAYFPVADHGVAVVGATNSDRLGGSERQLIEVLIGNLAAVLDSLAREASLQSSRRRYRRLAENIPNGAVLTFDADLTYRLGAGELLPEVGVEPSDIPGTEAGSLLPDADATDKLVSRFRAALDGERTDRRVEIDDRTVRVHVVPVETGDTHSKEARGLVLAQDITDEARRERELVEERERFRLLTESVDEYAFLIVAEDGTVQTWNEGAENLFGYDADAAVGMSMAAFHPETDRESGLPERLLQQARVAGESAHEGWRVRADGSEFYADVRYAPLEADDGDIRGFAKIVRDMTDRRRQQRRTEQFVEQSNDVVTIVDTDGTITYASGSADRVLGYDPDDLVGENLFDYLHPESREDAMETFFAGMENPDTDFQAECRLESGDGEWLNVEGQCRNKLADDAIDGMLLYLRDVTESKERARRFESIFNQTFQFTGLLDPDGTVVEANDAALDFGGIDRESIVDRPFYEAPWWTHSDEVYEQVRSAIDRAGNGEFVRYETEVRGADGLTTIDFSVKPVTDDDDTVTLLVVEGRDISRQQQQRQHMEVMKRVMRHNMRNDLTKMRGWTQVMCDENDPDKRAEQFETVERILDKWDEMTEKMKQIRQLTQSYRGDQPKMNAADLIEDAVAPLREEHADATITTRTSDGASVQVPTALLEAVRGLVDSAADVTDAGDITVGVESAEDGWTEISVSDNGPGLPDMEADVLETGEETALNHGQGLGLWMVRTVITQAGGDVSIESTDEGTDVCLRLPTAQQFGPADPS